MCDGISREIMNDLILTKNLFFESKIKYQKETTRPLMIFLIEIYFPC